MTIEEAIQNRERCLAYLERNPAAADPDSVEAVRMSIAALRCELANAEKEGRLVVLPPNDPLTLEELREMDGEPVWAESLYDESGSVWALADSDGDAAAKRYFFESDDYGKTWLAYRRRPEEGTA